MEKHLLKFFSILLVFVFLFVSAFISRANLVRFDWSLNYLKPTDSRFDAYSTAFTLEVPFQSASLGYYHEDINIKGQDGNFTFTTIAPSYLKIDALRLAFPLVNLKEHTGLPLAIEGIIDVGVANIRLIPRYNINIAVNNAKLSLPGSITIPLPTSLPTSIPTTYTYSVTVAGGYPIVKTKPMGDIGIRLTYEVGEAYGVQVKAGITALYRFLKISPTYLFGEVATVTGTYSLNSTTITNATYTNPNISVSYKHKSKAVDDLGGFEVGFDMTVAF